VVGCGLDLVGPQEIDRPLGVAGRLPAVGVDVQYMNLPRLMQTRTLKG
jgi:hypothetical protein